MSCCFFSLEISHECQNNFWVLFNKLSHQSAEKFSLFAQRRSFTSDIHSRIDQFYFSCWRLLIWIRWCVAGFYFGALQWRQLNIRRCHFRVHGYQTGKVKILILLTCILITHNLPLLKAMRTPLRDNSGVSLLFDYYNQLYFVERRFFPPDRSLGIYFEW